MSLHPGNLDYIAHRLRLILSTTDVATIHHDAAMALVVLEHLDGDVEARVAALNEQWQGKRVRTEDHTMPPSGNASDRLEVGNPFGGEGIAVRFYERGGRVWMQSDWGYEWVIEPTTTIIELPAEDDIEHDPQPTEPNVSGEAVTDKVPQQSEGDDERSG